MTYYSAPTFKTAIRPLEAALLILYLQEVSAREKSGYLCGFLDYITNLVLRDKLGDNVSGAQIAHAFEQAEAILADIRQNGEPRDWEPPTIVP